MKVIGQIKLLGVCVYWKMVFYRFCEDRGNNRMKNAPEKSEPIGSTRSRQRAAGTTTFVRNRKNISGCLQFDEGRAGLFPVWVRQRWHGWLTPRPQAEDILWGSDVSIT